MPYPPCDGGAIATLSLITGMAGEGHEVSVWSLNTRKHYVKTDTIPQELRDKIRWFIYDINTEIAAPKMISNYLFSGKPYIAQRFFSREASDSLREVLKKDHYEIVQVEGLYMLQYIAVIREVLGNQVMIAFRAHNIEHEIWQRRSKLEKNLLKKHYTNVLSRRIRSFKQDYLNLYDLLIPITERDARFFTEFGNKKPVRVIPAGINPGDKIGEPQEGENDIFFLGALDWAPNIEGLRWFTGNVWPLLCKAEKSLNFHIAGRNASPTLSESLRTERIIFHGEVPDARHFMQAHGVMIVPLFSGSGMRVKIVEGMSLGKAIVSTGIGAEGIGCKDGEEILIVNEAMEMADKILQLVRDKDMSRKIGENARRFAMQYFDNRELCKQLSEFYQQYVNR